jgi:hypothetical protein
VTSRDILGVAALVQTTMLAGCVVLIVVHRWYRTRRAVWLQPRRVAFDAAMLHWTMEGGLPARVLSCLARLPPRVAVDVLVNWTARLPGERWPHLAAALEPEPWARRIRADASATSWWKRLECARLLSAVPLKTDVPQLTRLIQDSHPAVHLAAVTALERIEDDRLTLAALERLPDLPPTVQAYYAAMLRRSRPVVVQHLLARLAEPGPALARLTEFAGRLAEPALRERLTALAAHPDKEVRIQATRALGSFPHRDSIAALERLAVDAAWEVRAQAARSVGMIADPRTLPLLQACLRDAVWWVRLRAALGLMRFAGPGRNVLLAAEIGADPAPRDTARLILGMPPQTLAEFAT